MADDTALRTCLVWLVAAMVVIGLHTQSLNKVLATYLFGMFAIAGVLLPDWDFFDRPISQWTSPVSVNHLASHHNSPNTSTSFRFYPIRTIVYATVYGFAFYKWWMYISS